MKLPHQLTREQLIMVVERIRDWLYVSRESFAEIERKHGKAFAKKAAKQAPPSNDIDYLDPDKEWDGAADILDMISSVLNAARLVPSKPTTVEETHDEIPPEILAAAESPEKEGALDTLVHDAVSETATHINNKGPKAQIEFLRKEGFSWKYIQEALGL